VRELRNLVEATLAMGEPPALEKSGAQASAPMPSSADVSYKDARATVLNEFERRYLSELVEKTKGNVSEASRRARMDRSHLIELLKKHSLR
jgi:DNA-binding NtrC family response regulator